MYYELLQKYADPPPYFEDDLDSSNALTSRRVLLIGIDGAVSSEVKAIAPAALTGMLAHAKFQWDGVSDEISTDATSWKSLVAGVSYGKHKIADSSFIFTPAEGSDPHAGLPPNYPSMFSYILSSATKSNMRTSFISSWNTLVDRVVPEIQDPVITTGDQAVKDSALVRIKTRNPEFLTLHFNGPSIAGKAGGFNQGNVAYKEAITKVDGYVGEIMTALKARPEYNKKEEWLVIVVSTHGGAGNSYGGSSGAETQAFQMFYNEKFKPLEFTTQGAFYGVRFAGGQTNAVRAIMEDANAFDPGSGPITYEMKVKGTRSGSFPLFFSKKGPVTGNMLDSGDPGFALFTGGNNNFNLEVRGGTTRARPGGGPAIFDETWHTISVAFADSVVSGATRRFVKGYADGLKVTETDVTTWTLSGGTAGWNAFKSPRPLILGWTQGNASDASTSHVALNVADIRIFNTGLSSAEIAANVCLRILQNTLNMLI
ncbi:alkaline phosphatase family protein [Niabella hibiscisoli]|uniref:alkaline phosphatase family protein n=1 Tax=Niabella hibiscisoli TaxID=1825928 RepID=UPI001F109270|nr:alkaline phosphatase family protein [Niabella hibiscisoli]MCH5720661.1 alkaline phosphatase family protein [Niabella hibiscisoli]